MILHATVTVSNVRPPYPCTYSNVPPPYSCTYSNVPPPYPCTYSNVPPPYPCTYSNVPPPYPCTYRLSSMQQSQFRSAEILFRSTGSRHGVCGGQSDTGTGFFRALPFYPISIIPPIPIILNYPVHTDTISSKTRTARLNKPQRTNSNFQTQLVERDLVTSLSFKLLLWNCSVLHYRSPSLSSFFLSIFLRYSPRWRRVNSLRLQTA